MQCIGLVVKAVDLDLTYEHCNHCLAAASYIDHSRWSFLLGFSNCFRQLGSLPFSGILGSCFWSDRSNVWFEDGALCLVQLCHWWCLRLYFWMSQLSCTCFRQEAPRATCSWAACPRSALRVSCSPSWRVCSKSAPQRSAFPISQVWCVSGWAGAPIDYSSSQYHRVNLSGHFSRWKETGLIYRNHF